VPIGTPAAMGLLCSQPFWLKHYAAEVRNLLAEVLPGSSRIMTSTYPADTTTLLNIVRPWHTFVPGDAPPDTPLGTRCIRDR
jgi:hypothetical protein